MHRHMPRAEYLRCLQITKFDEKYVVYYGEYDSGRARATSLPKQRSALFDVSLSF